MKGKWLINSGNIGKVSFQILNLMLYTFAISYFFALVDQEIGVATAQATQEIPQQEKVEFQTNCCKKTKQGNYCEDVSSGTCNGACDSGCIQTNCKNVVECKKGYCLDVAQGTCPANVPRPLCEKDGGRWFDANEGEPVVCKKGCCVVGRNTQFVTATQCKKISASYGLKEDFRQNVETEIECTALSESEDKGACVTEINLEKGCSMGIRKECTTKGGKFYKNMLCTSDRIAVGGVCKKTDKTTCKDDKVYFLDSCGNLANVYDFNRINDPGYWDLLLAEEERCGASESNTNSKNCGNCDYFRGSSCGVAKEVKPYKGNYICRDINCKVDGKTIKNGEGWCAYDGDIGDGTDLVGSRHWKRYCDLGEVKVEPCDDFRNYICVQENLDIGKGETFQYAKCRVNRWQECLSYNQDKAKVEKNCNENSDCVLKEVDVDKYFKFSMCTPSYSPGFDLSVDDRGQSAEKICGMGSNQCTVICEKKFSGWDCTNEDCLTKEFTEKMNTLCTSLGDCGLKKNIVGDADEGYTVKNAPRLLKSEAVGSLQWDGKAAKFGKYIGTVNLTGKGSDAREAINAANKAALSIAGIAGVDALVAAGILYSTGLEVSLTHVTTLMTSEYVAGTPLLEGVAVVGNVALGAAAGAAVAFVLVKAFGLEGEAALAMTIAGVALGAVTGLLSYLGVAALFGLGGLILVVVLVILAIVFKSLGIGKIKKKIVRFSCKPWEAPSGGAKCSDCNQNLLKPCSKYRCESLGQQCQFLNEGTKREACVAVGVNDVASPFISPNEHILSPGYRYSEVSQNGFKVTQSDGSCLQAFTPVLMGIQTNEPAQCRLAIEHTNSMEDMDEFFGGSNLYKQNHTMPLFVPSAGALKEEVIEEIGINFSELTDNEKSLVNILDDKLRGITGNLNIYVRCQDYNGNGKNGAEFVIKTCLKEGPDQTVPGIVAASPNNGASVGFNATKQNVSIFVNEPAECRWSRNPAFNFEQMENTLRCETGLESADLQGWRCNSDLTNLTIGQNQFYFRCKDQPWLKDVNESARNANQQSYSYVLKKTKDPLLIVKAEPNGKIISGKLLNTVTLEIETSGGAENGKAACYWLPSVFMYNTFSTKHTQILNDRTAGAYAFDISCEDIAGNTAQTALRFSLEIDATPPVVTRAFKLGDELKIITDESGECRYSFQGCNFKFEDGEKFSDEGIEHAAPWQTGQAYFIVCRDVRGNAPPGCSLRVKGYNAKMQA